MYGKMATDGTFEGMAKDGGKSPRPKPKPITATPTPAQAETEKKKTSKYRDIDEPWGQ